MVVFTRQAKTNRSLVAEPTAILVRYPPLLSLSNPQIGDRNPR